MSVVGVDGCGRGWVAVVLRQAAPAQAHYLANIGAIELAVDDAEVVAIDIPIGLVDSGSRRADREVRAALGHRRSSVFMTPVRAALEAETYSEANEISRSVTQGGVSRQSYTLREKILEVERWLPRARCAVREAHPELTFTELLGRPAGASKKTWQGMVERRMALANAGITLDDVDPHVGSRVGIDDLLDAAAVAWTARRILAGNARCVPDPPEHDGCGHQLAIWV